MTITIKCYVDDFSIRFNVVPALMKNYIKYDRK